MPTTDLGESNMIYATSPATGTLTGKNVNLGAKGFFYWDGSVWQKFTGGGVSSGWLLTGNAGTDPAVNFIGTTDDNDIIIKRNGLKAGWLNSSLKNTSWGVSSLYNTTTGNNNTAIGTGTLAFNTTGIQNTANGSNGLFFNTIGTNNTANGASALYRNTTGSDNTANGYNSLLQNTEGIRNNASGSLALSQNTTGYGNTANGYSSLSSNTIGNENTALGLSSGSNLASGNNNIAIGSNTLFPNSTGSNQLVLGNSIYGLNINDSNATNDLIGIGTSAPTNTLHVKSPANPLRLEGLQPTTTSATDKMLVVDTNGVLKTTVNKTLQYTKTVTSPVDASTPTNSITTLDNISVRYNGTTTAASTIQIMLNNVPSHVTAWEERYGSGGSFGSPQYETFALGTGVWQNLTLTLNPNNRDMIRYTINLHNTKMTYRVSVLGNGAIGASGSVPSTPASVTIFIEKLD